MRVHWLWLGAAGAALVLHACGGDDSGSPAPQAVGGSAAGAAGGGATESGGSAANESDAGGVAGNEPGGGAAGGRLPGAGAPQGGLASTMAGAGLGGAAYQAGQAGGHGGQGAAGASDGGAGAGVAGAGGASADCPATSNKVVFVSSEVYTGALGGLSGADDKCQKLADAAGRCGTFKAWLGNDSSAPADRFTHPDGDYVLVSGDVVASGWAGLTSGTLMHAIDVTEKNTPAPSGTVRCAGNPKSPVWTDVLATGAIVKNGSCSNWSDSSYLSTGVFGRTDYTNASWTAMCQLMAVCQYTAALYCVQQ